LKKKKKKKKKRKEEENPFFPIVASNFLLELMFKNASLSSFWPIAGQISNLRQMFKGSSPFKPFGSSFLGPLMAIIMALRYCLKTQVHFNHLLALFSWPIDGPNCL
jgi:hypothetical protein